MFDVTVAFRKPDFLQAVAKRRAITTTMTQENIFLIASNRFGCGCGPRSAPAPTLVRIIKVAPEKRFSKFLRHYFADFIHMHAKIVLTPFDVTYPSSFF